MEFRRHVLSLLGLAIMTVLAVGSIDGGGSGGGSRSSSSPAPQESPPRTSESRAPEERAIAKGRFLLRENGLLLPPTVTVFEKPGRERMHGFQVPRSSVVDVLRIVADAGGDTDYDQVKVRASGRVGWISRMQFSSITPIEE